MDLGHFLEMLASPDPVVRDETAYEQLAGMIRAGALDDRLVEIGDAMAERFTHPEVQARTFAPLVLAAVVRRPAGSSWKIAVGLPAGGRTKFTFALSDYRIERR